MKDFQLIKQHDEKDCGAACLSMIFNYYGLKLPLASVREAIQVDQNGATIRGILDGAEKYGINGDAKTGEPEEVWEVLSCIAFCEPAIIRILNHGYYEHYVVITKLEKNILEVYDPDIGKRSLTKKEFCSDFLGNIIFFTKTDSFHAENKKKGSLRRFTNMIFCQKRLLFMITTLSLLVTVIGVSGTFVFQYLIDSVLPTYNNTNSGLNDFVLLLAVLCGLYLVKLLIMLLRGKLLALMSKNIDLPLMLGYYDHVAELPMQFFETRKTGEILSRFTDACKIRDAISGATLTILIDTVLVIVCGTVIYHSSVTLFIIAMSTFLLYMIVCSFFVKPLDKNNRKAMEEGAEFNSYLKESVDGMETVKTCNAEEIVKTKTSTLFNYWVQTNIKTCLLSLSKESLIDFITSVSSLVLLWVGALNITAGSISVGSLITFLSLFNYFLSPVQNLVNLQGNIQTALVAADRLNDILDLKPEDKFGLVPPDEINNITFSDVSFRYGTRELTLNNISFSIEKGNQIALVGESGCGKSTVAKLLQGLYLPENGEITVNGIPISDLSITWLRKNTAFVPQKTFLFNDSIRNNITLGLKPDEIPEDETLIAILKACSCDFILNMPRGLDTLLEEGGNNLSGGQCQRLAIARALIKKPQLLILDEATSALDTISEFKIQKALRNLFPSMTVVMIAHRLSTIKQCNQILVLSNGTVIERGTHSELIANNKHYATLWNQQNNQHTV